MEVIASEFARLAGVTKQTVGAKIKNGTLIRNSGGKLDTDNPVNSNYLSAKQQQIKDVAVSAEIYAKTNSIPATTTITSEKLKNENSMELAKRAGVPAELLKLTLGELVMRYSGIIQLEKHAKILKLLMEATEKENRLKERRLTLIEKDFVISRLFQFIDMLMIQLLEYPDGIADDIVAKVMSEKTAARPVVVITLKNGLSKILAGSKEQIIKELDGLKSKYNATADSIDNLKYEIKSELEAERE